MAKLKTLASTLISAKPIISPPSGTLWYLEPVYENETKVKLPEVSFVREKNGLMFLKPFYVKGIGNIIGVNFSEKSFKSGVGKFLVLTPDYLKGDFQINASNFRANDMDWMVFGKPFLSKEAITLLVGKYKEQHARWVSAYRVIKANGKQIREQLDFLYPYIEEFPPGWAA